MVKASLDGNEIELIDELDEGEEELDTLDGFFDEINKNVGEIDDDKR